MIGIVLVSHSAPLADGLAEMARQITGDEVRVLAAGGGPEGTLGTDGDRIATAIRSADTGDGVLVLVDLGSAVLSVRALLGDGDLDDVRVILADARSSKARSRRRRRHRSEEISRRRPRPPGRRGMSASSEVTRSRIVRLPEASTCTPVPTGALDPRRREVRVRASRSRPATARPTRRASCRSWRSGATGGSELTVSTAGPDASDALEAIAGLLEHLA